MQQSIKLKPMVLLNSQAYGSKGKFHLAKFNYDNIEAAINRLADLHNTEIYTQNKYWIEDEDGKLLLNNKQTKAKANKQYKQK